MENRLEWEAVNASATFLAVAVALFGERFWAFVNRAKPALKVFHRVDVEEGSVVLLSVENSGDVITDAKMFLVAYEYRKGDRFEKRRTVPAQFEWLKNTKSETEGEPRNVYGEEVFPFLFSRRHEDNFWVGELRAYLHPNDDPFVEAKKDPNFEVDVYLQLKATNYVSQYWPIRVTYDSGTVGGWVCYPLSPMKAKAFLKRFPNLTEEHFRWASNRLHQ